MAAIRRFACSFLLVLTRERAPKRARKLSRKTTKRARESPITESSDCSENSTTTTISVNNDQLSNRTGFARPFRIFKPRSNGRWIYRFYYALLFLPHHRQISLKRQFEKDGIAA